MHVALVFLSDFGLDVVEQFLSLLLREAFLRYQPIIDDVEVHVEHQLVEEQILLVSGGALGWVWHFILEVV